jgi:2-polyprenyl-6-methoxyphenol hydroxylase-like FAD-dependent oxidoreductase
MMAKILVVGCGPTGLTVAGVLKSYGVDVTLIDKYPGVLKATKAAAIHARTI